MSYLRAHAFQALSPSLLPDTEPPPTPPPSGTRPSTIIAAELAPIGVRPGARTETLPMNATVARVCERLAGSTRPQVSPMERGRVQIHLHADLDERRRWVLSHRLRRELTLVGWSVEADASGLLVHGWSSRSLEHRIRVLRLALSALRNLRATIDVVCTLTQQCLRQTPRILQQDAASSVLADVERDHLRWPIRLAELEGLPRSSSRPALQRQLDTTLELERHLQAACSRHMNVAGRAAEAMWRHLADGALEPAAARRAVIDTIGHELSSADRPTSTFQGQHTAINHAARRPSGTGWPSTGPTGTQ
ncbi:hypothetical protein [Nonomuraea ceibae]|uniref:hypothetical protein n=1 Tax=Nonomuraea ceibae TaxID=1935170 RepID=UPI001C5E157D|nr:hypothetical protein [Nonomuraea ceibae]